MRSRLWLALVVCLAAGTAYAQANLDATVAAHRTDAADIAAIQALLAAYTTSVGAGDEAAFEALLLSRDIPFSHSGAVSRGQAPETRNYPQFRQAIFASGKRYAQTFHNVRISQDEDLAEVSLDFVTRDLTDGTAGYGWKVLHLLKVKGQWKIAAEFYTGRALPKD
ncbi:putative lumazine-binding protein [Nitrospirillum amazonense]|uniref:Putative lumazine-binding protein n=1 Tax=Nitrospirillum amazonense TaxID=28077 RepID=A0A560FA33_9PROT|nr:nuclear transport factor 2 family protein [Nitrospirillum amazonense]TWB18473.1 putative lumazine-binding protein [Nitrospirillum amazonense]